MQILYLSGDVNQIMVDNFLKEFNKIPSSDQVTIYINTTGGEVSHADILIDILNQDKDRITIVAGGEILSAGFNIFFFVECTKRIIEDTIGMVHFSWNMFELDEAGHPKTECDKFLMKDMRRGKLKSLRKFASIGLNTKEIARIRKGEEVYLTTKRLKQLLRWRKR